MHTKYFARWEFSGIV